MISLSKKWNYCLAGLLAVLGVLILCLPAFFIVILGLGAIAYGVYNLLYTKKIFENTSFSTIVLVRCIVSFVIGILAVFFPIAIGRTIWNATMYILAIYLVCTAGLGFYSMYLLKDAHVEFKNYLYENLALLVIAVLLFLMPGTVGNMFKAVIGGICILCGIALGAYTWHVNKNIAAEIVVTSESENPATEETPDSTESAEPTESSESSDSTEASSETNS